MGRMIIWILAARYESCRCSSIGVVVLEHFYDDGTLPFWRRAFRMIKSEIQNRTFPKGSLLIPPAAGTDQLRGEKGPLPRTPLAFLRPGFPAILPHVHVRLHHEGRVTTCRNPLSHRTTQKDALGDPFYFLCRACWAELGLLLGGHGRMFAQRGSLMSPRDWALSRV